MKVCHYDAAAANKTVDPKEQVRLSKEKCSALNTVEECGRVIIIDSAQDCSLLAHLYCGILQGGEPGPALVTAAGQGEHCKAGTLRHPTHQAGPPLHGEPGGGTNGW